VTGSRCLWAAVLLFAFSFLLPAEPGASRAAADAELEAELAEAMQQDQLAVPRLAPDTGYVVADDAFWGFYSSRGGAITFGKPISRAFMFRGSEIQLFERAALRKQADRSITVFNVVDLLPYETIEGYTIPAADPTWIASAPGATTANFASVADGYIRTYVPDNSKGWPVGFLARYLETVPPWVHRNNPTARFLAAHELWGFPISAPIEDPSWPIVYQRFERAIFVFDAAVGITRILPVGQYLQYVLVGSETVPDLAEQARGTALWQQYLPRATAWLRRPSEVPGTDLTAAFLPDAPAGGANVTSSSVPLRSGKLYGPEYGMNVFIWDFPQLMDRDLGKIGRAGFQWQKSLFQWRRIEPQKGVFDWENADRVVRASNAAGIKVIARVDFQPDWARAHAVPNGPPDRMEDFADFIFAVVDRYKPDSPYGTIHAVELWNEPNLAPFWGHRTISPAQAGEYVRLLCAGHEAAKRASRDIITISAGLSPTGTRASDAMDDTVYAQWLYDAGAKACFDVFGAHGAGYKAPPWIGPSELATDRTWGGHSSFGFRRIEQLRDIMVRNGDGDKQVWLTEFGWTSDTVHPSYAWHRVTEEEKAQYVVEAYRWAHLNWQPWIGVMVLWNLPSPDWTQEREEWWWAVANPDGTDRPAFEALVRARGAGFIP
jgi:hypothetical protein